MSKEKDSTPAPSPTPLYDHLLCKESSSVIALDQSPDKTLDIVNKYYKDDKINGAWRNLSSDHPDILADKLFEELAARRGIVTAQTWKEVASALIRRVLNAERRYDALYHVMATNI